MKVVCIFVCLVVAIRADYHDEIGIPLAAKIKALEDKIMQEVPDMESRVVGGEVAPVGAHPYLVGLIITIKNSAMSMSICGSSLVSATRLVTAAHCIDRAATIVTVLGSHYLHYGGIRMKTDVFVKHPRFGRNVSDSFDVGVVALPKPVELSEIIQPISLPWTPDEAEKVGEWGIAAGYGLSSDLQVSVPLTTAVREVRLEIISEDVCHKQYGPSVVADSWVCTSGVDHVGTCGGDSGGPLIVERKGRKILVGLTSFGTKECELSLPSVFTRVATYLDFIKKHL